MLQLIYFYKATSVDCSLLLTPYCFQVVTVDKNSHPFASKLQKDVFKIIDDSIGKK